MTTEGVIKLIKNSIEDQEYLWFIENIKLCIN